MSHENTLTGQSRATLRLVPALRLESQLQEHVILLTSCSLTDRQFLEGSRQKQRRNGEDVCAIVCFIPIWSQGD